MKMQRATAEVASYGAQDSTAFSIEMNSVAFQAVIDGIYADKVRAPVREYCTNAYDAHIAAGKRNVPFELQLPSRFDLTFRVRDYGVGLTHEQVMTHYTTMFNSSKRETNDQVGALGLGCKSAFAYTTIFTVTCYDGTQRRVYSAFLGDEGVPQMSLMATELSDEPTGVEISFPAKQQDIDAFRRAAQLTLLGFPVQPRVVNEDFTHMNPPVYSGNGWEFYADALPARTAYARQGCVIYPIDPEPLGIEKKQPGYYAPKLTTNEGLLLSLPIIIDFPIGELSVSTSREQLGYDERTKANLKARFGTVIKELMDIPQKELNKATTWLQACEIYATAVGQLGYIRDRTNPQPRPQTSEAIKELWQWPAASFNFKGIQVKHTLQFSTKEYPGCTFDTIDRHIKHPSFKTHPAGRSSYSTNVNVLDLQRGYLVVVEFAGLKFGPSRMKALREPYKTVDTRDPNDVTFSKVVIWIKAENEAAFAPLRKALGETKIYNLADVEPIVNRSSTPGTGVVRTKQTFRFLSTNSRASHNSWRRGASQELQQEFVEVDFSVGKHLCLKYESISMLKWGTGLKTNSQVVDLLKRLNLSGVIDTEQVLILIKEQHDLPDKHPNNFIWLDKLVDDYLAAHFDVQHYLAAVAVEHLNENEVIQMIRPRAAALPATLTNYLGKIDGALEDFRITPTGPQLHSVFNLVTPGPTVTLKKEPPVIGRFAAIKKKFPLLQVLANLPSSSELRKDGLDHYLSLIKR